MSSRTRPTDRANDARWRLYRAADREPVPWRNGGGVTYEITRDPVDATLDAFDWRISIARVDVAGPFSHFAGVTRTFAVLEGTIELCVATGTRTRLDAASPPLRFPGDAPVTARPLAPTLDLNVMTRDARCVAELEMLSGRSAPLAPDDSTLATVVVCLRPPTRLYLGTDALGLARHDACRIDGAGPVRAPLRLDVTGAACVIRIARAGR